MKIKFIFLPIIVILSLTNSCKQKTDLKRKVYFNFNLGINTKAEFDKEWEIFIKFNNGNPFYKHSLEDKTKYYSSVDHKKLKYDSTITFISVFFFLDPDKYTTMVNANKMDATLFVDGKNEIQVEAIAKDILKDLNTKYGSPKDTINMPVDSKDERFKIYSWENKDGINIKFFKRTIYDKFYDGINSEDRFSFSFRIIYEYTDEIRKKYFINKSPY